ncbi:uncharacterized protein LOC119547176 [Drosophila subpulchrella]|uniref:uncharacterized protein LOC119547176 n=1 Tax=Drosophila subpulchrella TaxID=1486046 RepID=UPI0018A16773|nr:uncharacterized protein LOC119547176 [Drosophila subpulchrella]
MASCEVQETRSQDELKKTENTKNVKNSEERGPLNFKSNNDMDAVATPSSETDLRSSRGSVTKMTRIPAPIYMGPSGSHHQISSRMYSSVLVPDPKVHNSLEDHQLTNDSGIQMESSMSELPETPLSVRPSPILQTILDRIPGTSSEIELRRAEEQTLKELQRVVAEMEAEVALDDMDMQDLQLDNDQYQVEPGEENHNITPEVGNIPEKSGLDMEQLSADETQQKQPSVSEEPPTNEELSVDNLQLKQEECAAKEESVTEEAAKGEELELFEKLAHEPAPDDPQIVLQEPTEESVVQEPEKSVPESLMDELEMAIGGGCETEEDRLLREQFERSPMGLKFPRPADENMSTISEMGLTSRPSLDGSVESDRRMVPLEELFDPEHNVELLRQLLQSGSQENVTEAEPVLDDSEIVKEKETEAAETDEEAEMETETEFEEETDLADKQTSKSFSYYRRLVSRKLLKLSYPILFCSLAISLIYLSRKE